MRSGATLTALNRLLDAAIRIGGATRGTIQIVNERSGSLEIIVHRGFDQGMLDAFHRVLRQDASACARAWHHGQRVLVADVDSDPYFGLYTGVSDERFRAAQATPLTTPAGRVIGVLSTYFPSPVRLSREATHQLDRLAMEIATVLDASRGRS